MMTIWQYWDYDVDEDTNQIHPRAHIDRMKAKEGLEVEEECPPEFAVVHEVESTSEFFDLDFGFIGGVIVATGIVLAKPFVLAFF